MRFLGQTFGTDIIERIRTTLDTGVETTRSGLSRRVCEWLDWRSVTGKPREIDARKALLALENKGLIELPPAQTEPPQSRCDREPPPRCSVEVAGALSDVGEVSLVAVSSKEAELSRLWNGLLDDHHPLGSGPLCGAQQRYLIRSEQFGWLGGLAFSAAAWHLRERDDWIGWSPKTRRANLHKVVANSRFLLLPGVRVPHLASHVLGLAAQHGGNGLAGIAMVIPRYCWRALSMKAHMPAPVIARRTGNGSVRPPGGADRTATTRVPTASRRSMSCPWTRGGVRR